MKVWAGVILFFGIGVTIGLCVAEALLSQPSLSGGFAGAVAIGAMAGDMAHGSFLR
jgi:hypothetical protein